MFKVNRFLIPIYALSLLSCNSSQNHTEDNNTQKVSLVKQDSIHINYLGNPSVHDINPKTGTILFVNSEETKETIHVANFDGEVEFSYPKFGDMPDTYGILFAPLKIIGVNEFLAYGINGLLSYDFTGKNISKTRISEIHPYNFARRSMGYAIGEIEEHYIYIDQGSRSADYSDLKIYEEVHTMIIIHKSTGEKTPIIKIPSSSLYRNGQFFHRDDWAPIFEITDENLMVIFGGEPRIYFFDKIYPFDLIKYIDLSLPNYNYFQGDPQFNPDSFRRWFSSGQIHTITYFEDHFVVGYFPGYDSQDQIESMENKSPEEARAFGTRMREKYLDRVAIFDSTGELLFDFAPEDYHPRSIIQRDGSLWAMQKENQDVELDYFGIFKIGFSKK
ncbi:hypothetical protein ACFOUP_02000 [Belliella kenyensis]|uniref:TolB-like 6-blade propeller-like n=1 Tax=Belliella kenyensis TaxID=1472724 RepID=A0ABV8EHS1_9BACT|nr:hypothetical protein [Belliella kenyensis]MCH7401032.1 hypothetical protein [Belliella kenyensis]MDN3604030.1 hypothetical protein [Belliella kenyensis]